MENLFRGEVLGCSWPELAWSIADALVLARYLRKLLIGPFDHFLVSVT